LSGLKDGLRTTLYKGQPIRALLRTRPDGSRFAVAQPTAVRDDTARDMAFRTLLPIAALIPFLLLVTALVIAHSLRPMMRLAGDLDGRRADDLTSLPLKGMPTELHPFIASINGLLARMRLLMDQQRRFLADAAHELRTPITALSLQAENLDRVELPKAALERVAALKQGMHRTKHLLERLLALARHEAIPSGSAEMPLVSLNRVAKEVVADLLPESLERGIDLGFALAEPLTVRGEPVMVAAIIRNLLDNALRFTPRGGNNRCRGLSGGRGGHPAGRRFRPRHPIDRPGSDLRALLPRLPAGRRRSGSRLVHREAHCRELGRWNRAGKHCGYGPVGSPGHNSPADCRSSLVPPI